jgi:hypothetical protein
MENQKVNLISPKENLIQIGPEKILKPIRLLKKNNLNNNFKK